MKQVMKALLIALALGTGFSAQAVALPYLEGSKPCTPKDGDPFPWLFPLEIPWDEIEGVWKTQGDKTIYIDVKVMGVNSKGARYVQVVVLSNPNQSPVAKGVGFVPKKERILEAMVAGNTMNGRIRVATIAFPTLGCSKFKPQTAVQIELYDKKGKEIVDEVMLMKKFTGI